MNKMIFVLLLLLMSFNSYAQKNKSKELGFYLADAQGNPVKNLDKAATYQEVIKQNDTTFIVRDYKNGGPMISQQSFKDENLSIPNGRFIWYDKDGDIDSTGFAENGHKNSSWDYYVHISYTDAKGNMATEDSVVRTEYYKAGQKFTRSEYGSGREKDSAANKNKTPADPFQPVTDTPKEAEFPGGVNKWISYLKRNLNTGIGKLIPQYNNLKGELAPVTISFLIDKNGNVNDVFILHSSGYPFDREAARVIEDSGNWIPARQFGKNVTYRQKQRIIFHK